MSEQWQRGEFPPIDEETEAQQRKGAVRTALVLLVIVLIIMGIAFYYFLNMRAEPIAEGESINVLLLGVTDEETDDRLDAVVVASFHPTTKAVEAVALPANTVLPWAVPAEGPPGPAGSDGDPGLETSSRAGLSAMGPSDMAQSGAEERSDAEGREPILRLRDVYGDGNRAALATAVQRLLDAPVHHTIRLDYSGFVELVNLLGGVSVDVVSEVTYRDEEGEVAFHLEPGPYRLDGEEALLYVRYKGPEGEDERVERQWRFVEQVVTEARSQLGWDKVQPLIRIALNNVSTDLDLADATRLARIVFDSERAAYALHVLPGADDEEGWIVDAERVAFLRDEMFHNPNLPVSAQ